MAARETYPPSRFFIWGTLLVGMALGAGLEAAWKGIGLSAPAWANSETSSFALNSHSHGDNRDQKQDLQNPDPNTTKRARPRKNKPRARKQSKGKGSKASFTPPSNNPAKRPSGWTRDPKAEQAKKVFDDVVHAVTTRHVQDISAPQFWNKLSQCAAQELDAYTFYMTAQERRDVTQAGRQNRQSGIRLARLHRDSSARKSARGAREDVVISELRPGSAAQQAGVEIGQRVLLVGDVPVSQLPRQADLDRVLFFASGASTSTGPNPEIALTVLDRHGQIVQLRWPLERQPPIPAVAQRDLACAGGSCLYFKLRRFEPGVSDLLRRARKRTRNRPLRGIIIDLRGNGGGELQEALKMADQFLDQGLITRLRGRDGKILREEKATKAESDLQVPLVLLIDRRSASASELLTAALQDHKRAWVIGEQSYGKGSVQDRVGFADGSYLQLTTARYFSPKDRPIDGYGVEPDMHLHFAHRHPRSAVYRFESGEGGRSGDNRAKAKRISSQVRRSDSGVAAALSYLGSLWGSSPLKK